MKTAVLYRMVMPDHNWPFGTKAKFLLQRHGFSGEDHRLRTRAETDAFKAKTDVKSTPQTFIDGKRVGGYDDLRKYFGLSPTSNGDKTTYTPVLALFGVAVAMALATQHAFTSAADAFAALRYFAAFSMCLLATQKLRDVKSFTNGFLNYDLLSQFFVPYAYVYPFLELFAGLGILSGALPAATAVIATFAGAEGALSVIKAVYIDKRELTCACMGGDSKVPLGFISLTENLMMIAMGAWIAYATAFPA